MSNDKTLATVKHGGCVQLGGGPNIEKRAREMLAAQFDTNGPCAKTAMTAQDTYTMGAVRALINALSAQPSPGGQGDALLPCPFCGESLTINGAGDGVHPRDSDCILAQHVVVADHAPHVAAWNRRALVARQPVCATVKDSLTVGGGLPVGEPERRAPVQGYHGKTIPWRIHGMAWEVYARKYPGQDAAKIASRGGFAVEEMDAFLPGWREMSEGTPAQAVDLGPPIAMIDQALRHLSSALDDLDSSPDRRPGGMVAEAMACLRQALTGVQS